MSPLVRNIVHGSCYFPVLPRSSFVAKQALQPQSAKTSQVSAQIFSRSYSESDHQKPVTAEEQISNLKLHLNNLGVRIEYLEGYVHEILPKKLKQIENKNDNINFVIPQKLKQIEHSNEKIASLLISAIFLTIMWAVYNTSKSNRLHNELKADIDKLKGQAEQK